MIAVRLEDMLGLGIERIDPLAEGPGNVASCIVEIHLGLQLVRAGKPAVDARQKIAARYFDVVSGCLLDRSVVSVALQREAARGRPPIATKPDLAVAPFVAYCGAAGANRVVALEKLAV